MKLYKDNRDIRDKNYKGELILEEKDVNLGLPKEEALEKIKTILTQDKEEYERQKEKLEEKLLFVNVKIDLIKERLIEIA